MLYNIGDSILTILSSFITDFIDQKSQVQQYIQALKWSDRTTACLFSVEYVSIYVIIEKQLILRT